MHVAISGGGTRAALACGGANLALLEAQQADRVKVASMTAVSGSAIMLTRLLIAGTAAGGGAGTDRSRSARREVHGVWRHGFRQGMAADTVTAFVLITALTAAVIGLANVLGSDDGQISTPEPPLGWAFVFSALLTLPAVLGARRVLPFDARHRARSGRDRLQPLEQATWFGWKQTQPRAPLLPTDAVWFTSVNLDTLELSVHSPWDEVGAGAPSAGTGVEPLPIGQLARASAAVPFHSQWVGIAGEKHADGGVLDNLGLRTVIDRRRVGEQVVVVDAAAPLKPQPQARAKIDLGPAAFVRYYTAVLVVTAAVGVAADLVLDALGVAGGRFYAVALGTAVLMVAANRPTVGLLLDWLETAVGSLRTEWQAVAAVHQQQRTAMLDRLVELGIKPLMVRLPEDIPGDEPPDFGTKLTRVSPDTGRAIVLHTYRTTCDHLGVPPSEETVSEIEGWIDDRRLPWLRRGCRRAATIAGRWLRRAFARTFRRGR